MCWSFTGPLLMLVLPDLPVFVGLSAQVPTRVPAGALSNTGVRSGAADGALQVEVPLLGEP